MARTSSGLAFLGSPCVAELLLSCVGLVVVHGFEVYRAVHLIVPPRATPSLTPLVNCPPCGSQTSSSGFDERIGGERLIIS
jgi:hypothetical protein